MGPSIQPQTAPGNGAGANNGTTTISRKRPTSPSKEIVGGGAGDKRARGDAGPSNANKSVNPQHQSQEDYNKLVKSVHGPLPETAAWGDEATKLDVYVWDYLTRRGFHGSAKTLVSEAGMVEIPQVPLRTPQGLLFEYWAIFWDVFAARNGRGSAEATAYHEFREQQQERQVATRRVESQLAQGVPPSETARFPNIVVGAGGQPRSSIAGAPSAGPNGLDHNAGRPNIPALAALTPQQQQALLFNAAARQGLSREEALALAPQTKLGLVQGALANARQGMDAQSRMQQSQQMLGRHLQAQRQQGAGSPVAGSATLPEHAGGSALQRPGQPRPPQMPGMHSSPVSQHSGMGLPPGVNAPHNAQGGPNVDGRRSVGPNQTPSLQGSHPGTPAPNPTQQLLPPGLLSHGGLPLSASQSDIEGPDGQRYPLLSNQQMFSMIKAQPNHQEHLRLWQEGQIRHNRQGHASPISAGGGPLHGMNGMVPGANPGNQPGQPQRGRMTPAMATSDPNLMMSMMGGGGGPNPLTNGMPRAGPPGSNFAQHGVNAFPNIQQNGPSRDGYGPPHQPGQPQLDGEEGAQQRTQPAFANPFAAGPQHPQGQQQAQFQRPGGAPPGDDPQGSNMTQAQHSLGLPGQHQGATPGSSGPQGPQFGIPQTQRPGMARQASGMGPPTVPAASPRAQPGNVGASPASTTAGATPKGAAAEKKKKETRARKNSKAANKTPVIGSASIATGVAGANAATPIAPTPGSSSIPTPGRDALGASMPDKGGPLAAGGDPTSSDPAGQAPQASGPPHPMDFLGTNAANGQGNASFDASNLFSTTAGATGAGGQTDSSGNVADFSAIFANDLGDMFGMGDFGSAMGGDSGQTGNGSLANTTDWDFTSGFFTNDGS
ncbi:WD40 repeat-containing protein [Ceraceosorus bombacis]|uniref:WD40 repeat-containing protein n=1 Tax=Ceraceosorus bombacis TaxID=401625 RepID=A0A0P1BB20_9BASI|nr:WD40 repeat-containing protein [Ceraceosorus bombacis]